MHDTHITGTLAPESASNGEMNAGELFATITADEVTLKADAIKLEAPSFELKGTVADPKPDTSAVTSVTPPPPIQTVPVENVASTRPRRIYPHGRATRYNERIEVKAEASDAFKRKADYHNAMVEMKAIADRKLANEGRRWAPNDHVWDWLRSNLKNMEHFIHSGFLAELLVQNDIALGLFIRKHGSDAAAHTLAGALAFIRKQMILFRARLLAIRNKHVSRRGSTYDAVDLVRAIDIAKEYVSFGEDFDRVVTAANIEIVLKFDEAGVDTSAVTPIDDQRITFPIKKAVLDEIHAERMATTHKKLEGTPNDAQ